jgi:hypothetical protein
MSATKIRLTQVIAEQPGKWFKWILEQHGIVGSTLGMGLKDRGSNLGGMEKFNQFYHFFRITS